MTQIEDDEVEGHGLNESNGVLLVLLMMQVFLCRKMREERTLLGVDDKHTLKQYIESLRLKL